MNYLELQNFAILVATLVHGLVKNRNYPVTVSSVSVDISSEPRHRRPDRVRPLRTESQTDRVASLNIHEYEQNYNKLCHNDCF